MKIISKKSLTDRDMLHIEEYLTTDDLIVEWREPDFTSISGGNINVNAKITLKPEVVEHCASIFGEGYNGFGKGGNFLGFYVDLASHVCDGYIGISEDYSLRGVRKDKQEAKKQEALARLKERANDPEEKKIAVMKFLFTAANTLDKMINKRNEETVRDSVNRVKGTQLFGWTEESDDTIAEDKEAINALMEKVKELRKDIRNKRTVVLENFLNIHGDEYDETVVENVREAAVNNNVFNDTIFGA